jgi:hypothetical protein
MQKPIFISYSTKDKEVATALCAHLEKSNLSCWMAPRDIAPGKSYAASIVDAINQAKIMVLVFSTHSNASDHVLNEVERAFNKKVTIIPFRISDTIPSSSMEYFLSLKHWLDAFENKPSRYFSDVQEICHDLLDNTNATASLPKPQMVTAPAKKNKPLLYGLGILGVLLVGYFIWSGNTTKMEATQTVGDSVAKVPVEIDNSNNITAHETKADNLNQDKAATPPQTPIVKPPDHTPPETLSIDNASFEDASSGDVLKFSRNTATIYGFNGSINGNSVAGTVKHTGSGNYQIIKSSSVKGSFQISENELQANVTLNKYGVEFSPGNIKMTKNN